MSNETVTAATLTAWLENGRAIRAKLEAALATVPGAVAGKPNGKAPRAARDEASGSIKATVLSVISEAPPSGLSADELARRVRAIRPRTDRAVLLTAAGNLFRAGQVTREGTAKRFTYFPGGKAS